MGTGRHSAGAKEKKEKKKTNNGSNGAQRGKGQERLAPPEKDLGAELGIFSGRLG
jgi:hypothetical protein